MPHQAHNIFYKDYNDLGPSFKLNFQTPEDFILEVTCTFLPSGPNETKQIKSGIFKCLLSIVF